MGATLFFDHCGSVRDRDVPTGFKARGREGRCPGRARARIAAGTGDAPAFASDMIRVSGSIVNFSHSSAVTMYRKATVYLTSTDTKSKKVVLAVLPFPATVPHRCARAQSTPESSILFEKNAKPEDDGPGCTKRRGWFRPSGVASRRLRRSLAPTSCSCRHDELDGAVPWEDGLRIPPCSHCVT